MGAIREKSKRIYEASCALIPGGVNSPVRCFPGLEIPPIIVSSGKGDTLYDADGECYIDYCCSWGALIIGHAHDAVVNAIKSQVNNGTSYGTATPIELELASQIVKDYPSVEKIRFVSSGTEAVMTAIRVARAFTGRDLIVKFNGNYHGHSDGLLVNAGSGVTFLNAEASSKGVPADFVRNTASLPFNDIVTLRQFLDANSNVAAIILEPIVANMGVVPARRDFIECLREETENRGILLIFDEVITGYRVGLKGAQGFYRVLPDLTCFGKIISGGLPAAAFGGSAEIMNHLAPLGEVYQAGTLSGNPIAMAAGIATLKEVHVNRFYQGLEEKTNYLLDPIRVWIEENSAPVCLQQAGSMFTLFFGVRAVTKSEDLENLDHALFKQFFIHLFERGIYLSPSPREACFISSAHRWESLEKTRECILEFLKKAL